MLLHIYFLSIGLKLPFWRDFRTINKEQSKNQQQFYTITIFPPLQQLDTMAQKQLVNTGVLEMGLKAPSASLEDMKKTILTEIPGVTEDDLNVMSIEEIKTFYDELILGSSNQIIPTTPQHRVYDNILEEDMRVISQIEKPTPNQSTAKVVAPLNKIKNSQQANSNSNSIQQKSAVTIEGVQYYKPKYLEQQSYTLAFNRYDILYGPKLSSIQDKRIAISKAYSPTVFNTIKGLKPTQVDQTYARLRQPEKKQHDFLKLSNPPQIQKFRIYVQKLPSDQNLKQLEKKHQKQGLKKFLDISNISHKENVSGTIENSTLDKKNYFGQNQKKGQKVTTREEKNNTQSKQKKSMGKKKQCKQKSVQTENSAVSKLWGEEKSDKRNTTTILSFTQYVEDDDLEPTAFMRPRPQNWIMDEQQIDSLHKISGSEVKKLLMEPHQAPKQEILEWTTRLGNLVKLFQQQYLNQFRQEQKAISN